MKRVIDAYARLLERRRLVVALFVAVVSAIFVFSALQLRTDDQLMSALRGQDALETPEERELVRHTENSCVIVLCGHPIFSPTGARVLRGLDDQLNRIEGVEGVESLTDIRTVRRFGSRRMFLLLMPSEDADAEQFQTAKQRALEHPFVKGNLLTPDGTATSVVVALDHDLLETKQLRPVIQKIRETIDEVTRDTHFHIHLTGMPVIRVQNSDVVVQDQLIFNVVGSLLGFVVNLFMLRRIAAVAIVTAGAWLGVFWTFGFFGLSGQPLSPINGIVAPLALTIALTDSIHLLLQIRKKQEAGLARKLATAEAVREVGAACTLTTLTTVIGFLSLTVADLAVLRDLGYCCAIAVGSAYFAVMAIVPLLATTFLGDHIRLRNDKTESTWSLSAWIADRVLTHPRVALGGGIVLTLVFAALAMRLQTDIRMEYQLPHESRESLAYSDSLFKGTIPVLLKVQWSADTNVTREQIVGVLEELHAELEEPAIMSQPLSLLTVLQTFPAEDNESLAARMSELKYWPKDARDLRDLAINTKERSMYLYMRCQDAGSALITADLNKFEAAFETMSTKYPGFTFRILDGTILSSRVADKIVSDLMRSLLLAIPITLVIIAWSLRSVYYGWVGFLPNVFPMFALAACLVLLGKPLMLVGAVVFTISFGVAVDDTIHVLSNFKKSWVKHNDARLAVSAVYHEVGDALVFSTFILLAGMGVVMLSRTIMVQMFGGMFCVTLLFALVADLVLLPALLVCFPPSKRPPAVADQPGTD